MAININGLNSSQNSPARGKEKVQSNESPSTAVPPAKTDGADQVKLSPEAKTLQDLENKLAGFPEVNPEKIELIRRALREGNYQIHPTRLAAKIVKFELDI